MSTKASIFLTQDNEHWYEETNKPHYNKEKFLGYTIFIEMDKKNIIIDTDDDTDLVIQIKPGSELYDLIKSIKQP